MNNRRRRRGDGHEEHADERWLLTYSDMITLLMALFIVMWAISSVNISKFEELKKSLASAFSGQVLQGSPDILEGGDKIIEPEGTPVTPPAPSENKAELERLQRELAAQRVDLQNLHEIQVRIDSYARVHGLSKQIETTIDERGLVVRLLTDEVLFDTGEAVLKERSRPLLTRIARLITGGAITNPIRVEGHTDDVPIATARFRNNWELSASRAAAVGSFLLAHRLPPARLSIAGYADTRPIASNSTASGRALNRRVELVVLRKSTPGGSQ